MNIPVRVQARRCRSAFRRTRTAAGPKRVLAAGGMLALAAGTLAAAPAVPASAAVAPPGRGLAVLPATTERFHYVGDVTQIAVVPQGVTSALLNVIGGMGGATYTGVDYAVGGDGAHIIGRLSVIPGEELRLQVAGYGGDEGGRGGWGATGFGGPGGSSLFGPEFGDGAGGGGASGVEIGTDRIAIAGGGGGGGGEGLEALHQRGGPGGSSGTTVDPGHNGTGLGAGKGGGGAANGQPAGGAGGNGSYGGGGGGGGGAGILGGAGGGGGGFGGGGGGGGGAGSSYSSPRLSGVSIRRGVTSDGNGLITIAWEGLGAQSCAGEVVHVAPDSPGVPLLPRCSDFGGPVSFRVVSPPEHGRLQSLNAGGGTFWYVPDRGYAGPDSVTFLLRRDDVGAALLTVTLLVEGPPGRP
jgi:hypothetical protein